MKKFLIGAICIVVLCSCSSKKKEAEYWKGWVAMNAYGYSLQKDYKEQYNYHMEFSPLFSENETTVVLDGYWGISWLEKDLTNLASKMYEDMIDEVISSYSSYVEDRMKSVSTKEIIAEAIDNCLTDHTKSSSGGEKYYNVYQDLPDEAGEKYKGRKGIVSYSIDWLVNDENNLNKLNTNLIGFCGNYKDLPKGVGESRKFNEAWTRYDRHKPSKTIDTGHRNHFHYLYNRIPTVRENARLQSFPDKFIFKGTKTQQYRQVGNAVPPILGYYIAKAIEEQLNETKNKNN